MANWKPISGREDRYEISDQGEVKSLSYRGHGHPKVMKSTPNGAGYHVIVLGADRKQYRLQVLVLEAFVGPRPSSDHDACHNNHDKNDNRLTNLRWDTCQNNLAERTLPCGEDHHNAKLSNLERDEVAHLRRMGFDAQELANRYSITRERVYQLGRRRPPRVVVAAE